MSLSPQQNNFSRPQPYQFNKPAYRVGMRAPNKPTQVEAAPVAPPQPVLRSVLKQPGGAADNIRRLQQQAPVLPPPPPPAQRYPYHKPGFNPYSPLIPPPPYH